MAQMVVRNVPDDVLAMFKEMARERGRSQEEEARLLIEEAVAEHRAWREFGRKSDAWLETLRAEGREFDDSTEIVRRTRDER